MVLRPKLWWRKEKEGGLISSGIDCWLKVSYPVINKWYKASEEQGISYHEEHGEGLDNYHVGIGRGAGGLAIKGADDQYFVSKILPLTKP